MNAGRLTHFEEIEIELGGSWSIIRTLTTYGGFVTSSFQTQWAEDQVTSSWGVQMYGTKTRVPSGGERDNYFLLIPAIGVAQLALVAGGAATIDSKLRLFNVKTYVTAAGRMATQIGGYEWYVGGALQASSTSTWTVEGAANFLQPSAIPVIGTAGKVATHSATNPALSDDFPIAPWGNFSTDASALATWSIRYKFEGTWFDLPLSIVTHDYAQDCAYSAPWPELGGSSGTNIVGECRHYEAESTTLVAGVTYECTLGQDGVYDVDHQVKDIEHIEASAWVAWDLTKAVKKASAHRTVAGALVDDDYGAIIYRGGMPRTQQVTNYRCYRVTEWPLIDPPPSPKIITEEVHPRESEMLSVVQAAAHEIEDPFTLSSRCGVYRVSYRHRFVRNLVTTITPYVCADEPPGPPPDLIIPQYVDIWEAAEVFPQIESSTENGALLPYLNHVNTWFRYQNYNVNPHWSYFYYYPPDADLVNWSVSENYGGAPVKKNSDTYWIPIRSQYLDHEGTPPNTIPTAEKLKLRNHLPYAPLGEGRLRDMIAGRIGVQTSWWGITRWKTHFNTLVNDERNLKFPDAPGTSWQVYGGSAVYSAATDIFTITPSAGTTVLRIYAQNYQDSPGNLLTVMPALRLSVAGAGVTSFDVIARNYEGQTSGLSSGPVSAGTVTVSISDRTKDSHYAGNWAEIGWGLDGVDDNGSDIRSNGASTTRVTSPEMTHAYYLMGGKSTVYWEIEVDGDGVTPFTIGPIVALHEIDGVANSAERRMVWLDGYTAGIYQASGTHFRWGSQYWWDPVTNTLNTPPLLTDQPTGHFKSTIVDMLAWSLTISGFHTGYPSGYPRNPGAFSLHDWIIADGRAAYDDYEFGFDTSTASRSDILDAMDLILSAVGTARCANGIEGFTNTADGYTILAIHSLAEVPPINSQPCAHGDYMRQRESIHTAGFTFKQQSTSFAQKTSYYVNSKSELHLDALGSRERWTTLDPLRSVNTWRVTKHRHQVDNTELDQHWANVSSIDYAKVSPWRGYLSIVAAAGGGGNLSSTVDPFAGFEYILIREESTGALEFWMRGPDGVNDKFAVKYGAE